jgi:hypothetical protein
MDNKQDSISDTQLDRIIEQSSQRGATIALNSLGLSDGDAAKDMAELRELLSAWRDAKSTARKAVIGWFVKMILALLLIGLAVKLGLYGLINA